MKITAVYISNRAGCLDILQSSLSAQEDPGDWELVVVDGYPGRVERGMGEQYLISSGLPIRAYVPPKAKTFPWSRTGFANAMNTGVIYAGGEYVVFIHDYVQLPPDALRRWRETFTAYPKTLISGIGQEYLADKPNVLDDIHTWESYPVPLVPFKPWIPEQFEVFYWGAPVSFFEESNGIDERADFCSQFSLYSLMTQARGLGYDLQVNHSLLCHSIDHRKWDEGVWQDPRNSEWRMKGVYSDVPEEPEWTSWGANPYHMRTERERVERIYGMAVRPHPRYFMVGTRDVPKPILTEGQP